MATENEDNLNTSDISTYSSFELNFPELAEVFTSSAVKHSNVPEGTFRKPEHCDFMESLFENENFSQEEETNFDEDNEEFFRDSNTAWDIDDTAALMAEIDSIFENSDWGINGPEEEPKSPQHQSLEMDANRIVVETPFSLFYLNPPPIAEPQEEENTPQQQEKSFENPKPVEKALKNKRSLQSKKKTNSKTPQRFTCNICGRPFINKKSSQHHEYTHMSREELEKTNIPHEKCEICHKIFFQKTNYKNHLNYHNKIQPHQCRKCDRKFTEKGNLTKHILYVHSTAEKRKKIRKSWNNQCDVCSMKFQKPSHLAKHKSTHSNLKSFNCLQCDKKYKSKQGLTNHKRTHDGRLFKCGSCDKEFGRLPNLKQHELIHSNQKNFNCYFCPKPFIRKRNLTGHMNAVHLNEKPFNCGHCKKGFANKSSLNLHVKSVHLDIRFSCSKCTRTFRQKGHLTTHMKSFHNEQMFKPPFLFPIQQQIRESALILFLY